LWLFQHSLHGGGHAILLLWRQFGNLVYYVLQTIRKHL
jgi:hypothetical protein